MERPLFDPSRIRGAQPPGAEPASSAGRGEGAAKPGQPPLLSVRQANEMVRGALLRHLPPALHVVGEVCDLSRPASGHLYFCLKDDQSELRCVMWRSSAVRLRFALEDGLQVVVSGAIEAYSPRGMYQLIANRVEPRGRGALELALRQLRERLERAGLFAAERKRPLPRFPERIAIITAPRGAAIRDILRTLHRRYRPAAALLFPVRVQGDGAAIEIAEAIRQMNRYSARLAQLHGRGIDVAIVGRGGGSQEDLWAFNEEPVVRAVAASTVPIISAVGHEIDVTLCDLAADVRAATPTAAAELATPNRDELLLGLGRQRARAARALSHGLRAARSDFQRLALRDVLARPLRPLRERGQRLDELQRWLTGRSARHVADLRARLHHYQARAAHFLTTRPFAVLARELEARRFALLRGLHGLGTAHERQLHARLTRLRSAAPLPRLAQTAERLRQLERRLMHAFREGLQRHAVRLDARAAVLAAQDPRNVLKRGYSLTRDARSGAILRSISQIRDGQRIVTQVGDGEFRSTADDPRQPGLFDA